MNRFIICLFLLSTPLSVFSQIRTPFPDSTGAWTIRLSSSDCCPPITTYDGFRYYIEGDTVFNSITYHKVYIGNTSLTDSLGTYYGAFRENNQKIFYRGQNTLSISSAYSDTVEYMLYDFNLNMGDSILVLDCIYPSDSGYIKVLSIDSLLLNGYYYKRWNFSSYYFTNPQWIEGIGSLNGFFPYVSYSCPTQWDLDLACFHENTEDILINLFGSSSCETVGISEPSANDYFTIFPNPTSGDFTIRLEPNLTNAKVIIYDIAGKVLFSERIVKSQETISLAGFDDGIYFIAVNTGNSQIVQKLILNK